MIVDNGGSEHDHSKSIQLLLRGSLTIPSLASTDFIFETFHNTWSDKKKKKTLEKGVWNVLANYLNKIVNFPCENHQESTNKFWV